MSKQGLLGEESVRDPSQRTALPFSNVLNVSPFSHELPSCTSAIRRVSGFFRPSILCRHKTVKLRPTACLDGLRGIAAFVVYVAHSEAWKHDNDVIQLGYGYAAPDSIPNRTLITLPFLRLFITGGAAAVAIFFVISGFVLARHPLELIHQRSDTVHTALSSAVFRRAIRLYVPFIGVTVTWLTMWHLFGIRPEWPKAQPTYAQEISNWWQEFIHYVNPFQKPSYRWFTYDFPLWTIPVEYQGSILVFTTLLSFARLSSRARLCLTSAMAIYFLHIGIWQSFCFLSGLILAEVDLIFSHTSEGWLSVLSSHRQILLWLSFIIAMYISSQPSLPDYIMVSRTPGWQTLASLVPQTYIDEQWWRFWLALSAPIIIFTTTQLSLIKHLLERPFPQYLGRISFALYLIHIPVQVSIGDVVYRMSGFTRPPGQASRWDNWFPLPTAGPLGFEIDFLIPQMIILPITFYRSELVTKLFDEPSVWIGKWAYAKVVEW